jgi:hypothetical protein
MQAPQVQSLTEAAFASRTAAQVSLAGSASCSRWT